MARQKSMKPGFRGRWGWRFIWPWLLVLAVYAVIFWFSAQPGEISDAQSAAIKGMLGGYEAEWLEVFVRKFAHVSLFFVLGALAGFAWLRHGGDEPSRYRRAVLYAVALCAALAASDEFHQFFVPGRAALVSDVMLDTASSALGALCLAGLAWLRARKNRRRNAE